MHEAPSFAMVGGRFYLHAVYPLPFYKEEVFKKEKKREGKKTKTKSSAKWHQTNDLPNSGKGTQSNLFR